MADEVDQDSSLYAPKSPDLSFFSQSQPAAPPESPRSPGRPPQHFTPGQTPYGPDYSQSHHQKQVSQYSAPSQLTPQQEADILAAAVAQQSRRDYQPPVRSLYTPQAAYQPPTPGRYPPHSSGTAATLPPHTPSRPQQGQHFDNFSYSQSYLPPQPASPSYLPPQQPLQTPSYSIPDHRQEPAIPYTPSHPPSTSAGGGIQTATPPNPQLSVAAGKMPPRKMPQAAAPAPEIEPSPVRTKFPTARIKRIMQADEEVGKVAQQTPIAVGKALELFMVSVVRKSAEVAKDKGQKRITAQMLKQVVEKDDQFDFLREIVSKVEVKEESSNSNSKTGSRTKNETESEDEYPEPKRRARGGRKKRGQ